MGWDVHEFGRKLWILRFLDPKQWFVFFMFGYSCMLPLSVGALISFVRAFIARHIWVRCFLVV
jgi:hypothetical protein